MLMLVRPWTNAHQIVLGQDDLADGWAFQENAQLGAFCCLGTGASSGDIDENRPKGQFSSALRYRIEV